MESSIDDSDSINLKKFQQMKSLMIKSDLIKFKN